MRSSGNLHVTATHLIDDVKRYGPVDSALVFACEKACQFLFNRVHSGDRIAQKVLNKHCECSRLGVIGLSSRREDSGAPHNRSRTAKPPKSIFFLGTYFGTQKGACYVHMRGEPGNATG